MKEMNYMKYAEFVERVSGAFCDILSSGLQVPEISKAHNMEVNEVKLLQDGIYRGCSFWGLFAELCADRFGVNYIRQWERRKRYVDANTKDEDYQAEIELLHLQGDVLGSVRLLYGSKVDEVREIVLHERDKDRLRDWRDAAIYASSFADFIEYINRARTINQMLAHVSVVMDNHMRDACGLWD